MQQSIYRATCGPPSHMSWECKHAYPMVVMAILYAAIIVPDHVGHYNKIRYFDYIVIYFPG